MSVLKAGYNVVINQKVGANSTPIYPFTRTGNVVNAAGDNLDTVIATLATKAEAHYVPANEETVSNLRFLRNDNTWATIQSATTEQLGVVQLSDATDAADSTKAATSKAVNTVAEAVAALEENVGDNYVKLAQLGVATTAEGVVGVATLDTTGLIPAAQLPSYVDDVIEVAMVDGKAQVDGKDITGETGKIYADVLGDDASGKIYRWSGTTYVVISETLALGTTASTAFRGDYGNAAYQHSLADHARVDATLTESSTQNGYIKINGTETLVYTHPSVDGASATNPHGTTAADVGLGKVENKTSEEIRAELTSDNVTTALGYTPQNAATLATASNNGVMSAAYAAKLDGCLETAVNATAPTFASGSGIWYEIISNDSPAEDAGETA